MHRMTTSVAANTLNELSIKVSARAEALKKTLGLVDGQPTANGLKIKQAFYDLGWKAVEDEVRTSNMMDALALNQLHQELANASLVGSSAYNYGLEDATKEYFSIPNAADIAQLVAGGMHVEGYASRGAAI
jgi:hypothetical protein